jgi:hypothetical protein
MRTWSGTANAASFAERACTKRYPRVGFLYTWPRSRQVFDAGYRVVVCAPRTSR